VLVKSIEMTGKVREPNTAVVAWGEDVYSKDDRKWNTLAAVDFSPTLKVPWLEEADLVLWEVELVEVLEGGDGVTGELV
jgi:hypothetical protein